MSPDAADRPAQGGDVGGRAPWALAGLVLAAGAGRRYGRPKALVVDGAGVGWIERAVAMLVEAGCRDVVVVLGAEAASARGLVPAAARVVEATDWAEGMGASLRAGIREVIDRGGVDALVVTPVDTPDAPAAAVDRVLVGLDAAGGVRSAALAQAVYGGRPGHPVVIGRDHWSAVAESARGDRGARAYLVEHGALEVDCSELWPGDDVDRPDGQPGGDVDRPDVRTR